MLFGGDWRQTAPVLPRVDRDAIVAYTLRATAWWNSKFFLLHQLKTNHRAAADARYARWLLCVGENRQDGQTESPELPAGSARLLSDISAPAAWTADDLLDWVFDGMDKIDLDNLQYFYADRAVLTPTNELAKSLNDIMLGRLASDQRCISYSVDSVLGDASENNVYSPEFLHGLESGGLPPHELALQPGMLAMVLRNYAPHRGICNGTRVVLRHVKKHLLQAQLITGPRAGTHVLLPRIFCDSSGDVELPFTLRRLQYPLKPAWAFTINKGQGQTLAARVGLYLSSPVFAHGQLYTGLSRATSSARIRVLVRDYLDKQLCCDSGGHLVVNIVQSELIRSRAHRKEAVDLAHATDDEAVDTYGSDYKCDEWAAYEAEGLRCMTSSTAVAGEQILLDCISDEECDVDMPSAPQLQYSNKHIKPQHNHACVVVAPRLWCSQEV